MANLTSVGISSGVPNSGTGTVSTIDALMADGGQATIGATTGAAVVTDADGTLQRYLRGLVKLFAAAIVGGAGSLFSKITDGTNTLAVDAHGSAQTTLVDSSGTAVTFNNNGQAAMVDSAPSVLADDMPILKGYYVAVAASQTNAVLQSTTGAAGDYLDYVVVTPATTAPGVVTILDNATALISYVGGGTTALLTLVPFIINVGAFSRSGAWKITTGANVSVLAVGKFS